MTRSRATAWTQGLGRVLRGSIIASVAWAGMGCGGGGGDTAAQIAQMQMEIRVLRDRAARLEERVVAMEATAAVQEEEERRPELEVVKLTPPPPEIDDEDAGHGPIGGPKPKLETEADEVFQRALDRFKNADHAQALEGFAEFVVRFPGDRRREDATYYRGRAYFALGKLKAAAEQYEAVVGAGGPREADAWQGLIATYEKLGDEDGVKRAKEGLARAD